MLQVLLTILKILGILILVILGIILTVLLLVLFVPLRYRGDVSFDGKPKGGVLVSWLLRFVTVRVDYDGDALKALVKVLWFRVFEQKLWPSEEESASDDLAEEISDDGFFDTGLNDLDDTPSVISVKEQPVTAASVQEPVKADAVIPVKESRPAAAKANVQEPKTKIPKTVKPAAQPKAEIKKEINTSVPEPEKTPFFEKMYQKIRSLVLSAVEKLHTTYKNLNAKYTAGQDKIEMAKAFLSDKENQKTLHLIKRQIIRLLKHILPRKMKGRIRFGFEDPATTGQILTYISPFYGWYAKSVTIEPVFDEKVIDGELHLKGHIRVAVLLWIVVRVILNKNFRVQVRKFLKSRK